ncbi:MAG: methyl-accepting chemotaxis protein [Caulobacteraceae bacterium]|nr:methyl-accepting chemotaxis protein [Caulobacteraceae bacterium]
MASESNLDARLNFIQLDEKSRSALKGLRPFLHKEMPVALKGFYGHVRAFPETRVHFRDDRHMDAASARQESHWAAIATAQFDSNYDKAARSIGATHQKIGLEPRWYIGGYAVVLDHLIKAIVAENWPKGLLGGRSGAAERVGEAIGSLVKATLLDMDLALTAYIDQAEAGRERDAEAIALSAEAQSRIVDGLANALGKLSGGDLTAEVPGPVAPEYEILRADFNSAMAALREAMSAVVANADSIRDGADEIAQASDDLSRRTEQQAASLEETAAALDQLTNTVKKSADGARQASAVVDEAKGEAEHSGEVVRQAVAAMGEIERSSHQISQIIGVIDEIAFQTNLLALNAGVEAARAGEAGRGFAVVAQEVRALAQRSAGAAKEIKGLISSSSAQVGTGVTLVGQTGDALQRIVNKVAEIDALVSDISGSAQEQATGLAQVNIAVNQMDQVTQQNAAMVEESTAATHSLRGEAAELIRLVSGFRIGAPPRGEQPVHSPRAPAHRASAPALKAMGGRGVSAARKPDVGPQSTEWEEF